MLNSQMARPVLLAASPLPARSFWLSQSDFGCVGKLGHMYEFGDRKSGFGFGPSSAATNSEWSSEDCIRYIHVCKFRSRGAVKDEPLILSVLKPYFGFCGLLFTSGLASGSASDLTLALALLFLLYVAFSEPTCDTCRSPPSIYTFRAPRRWKLVA